MAKLQRPTTPTSKEIFAEMNERKISVAWWEDRKKWIANVRLASSPNSALKLEGVYFQMESSTSAQDAVIKLLEKLK